MTPSEKEKAHEGRRKYTKGSAQAVIRKKWTMEDQKNIRLIQQMMMEKEAEIARLRKALETGAVGPFAADIIGKAVEVFWSDGWESWRWWAIEAIDPGLRMILLRSTPGPECKDKQPPYRRIWVGLETMSSIVKREGIINTKGDCGKC